MLRYLNNAAVQPQHGGNLVTFSLAQVCISHECFSELVVQGGSYVYTSGPLLNYCFAHFVVEFKNLYICYYFNSYLDNKYVI